METQTREGCAARAKRSGDAGPRQKPFPGVAAPDVSGAPPGGGHRPRGISTKVIRTPGPNETGGAHGKVTEEIS